MLILSVVTRLTRWANPKPKLLGQGSNFYNPKKNHNPINPLRLTRNPMGRLYWHPYMWCLLRGKLAWFYILGEMWLILWFFFNRSPCLKRLHLESCHLTSKDSIEKAVAKFGDLEELHLTITMRPCLVGGDIIVRGNSRPTLKSFSYNGYAPHHNRTCTTRFHESDYFRHQFELALNRQTHARRMLDWTTNNEEFGATILNACPRLKSLDIRTNSLVQYLWVGHYGKATIRLVLSIVLAAILGLEVSALV